MRVDVDRFQRTIERREIKRAPRKMKGQPPRVSRRLSDHRKQGSIRSAVAC